MHKEDLPNLTFEGVPFGEKETPWNLVPLLYKGGAAVRVDKALGLVDSGALGPPLKDRMALIVKLHEVIAGNLAGGSSKWSELGGIETIRRFIRWVDEHDVPLDLDVEFQKVVHARDAAYRRLMVQGRVWPKPVVGVNEGLQGGLALG